MKERVSSRSSSAGKKDSPVLSPGVKSPPTVRPQHIQKNGGMPRPGGCGCGKRKTK